MGQVAVTIRIMPKEADGFEKMKDEVIKKLKPAKNETIEIGFGLKALRAVFVVPDGIGGADKIEEMAKDLSEVGQIDIESMDRI